MSDVSPLRLALVGGGPGSFIGPVHRMAAELDKIVTQVVPLSNSEGIFAMIADPAVNTVKVLVDCEN